MKTKKLSILIATIMVSNSVALAGLVDSSLKKLTPGTNSLSQEEIDLIVGRANSRTLANLIVLREKVKSLADSLRSIQNSNESDIVLNYANKLQVILVGVSAIALKSHIKSAEKSKYALQLAALTALVNSFIRHYSELKNLKPTEVGLFLTSFTDEMTKGTDKDKAVTLEMNEMAISLRTISNQLIAQKSQVDNLITNLGGGSDIATAAILFLAAAHWLAPKLDGESKALMTSLKQKIIQPGTGLAQNSKVIGTTGVGVGAPDLIGITLGLDGAKSQEMITSTLNNLDIAMRRLDLQIEAKKQAKQ